MHFAVKAIHWKDGILTLLDQRKLPQTQEYLNCATVEQVASAIKKMVVRGAPAIAISAAYGMALAAQQGIELARADALLRGARPTAVNLSWALDRLQAHWQLGYAGILAEATKIEEEDLQINRAIALNGAAILARDSTILTHCNTGSLATAGIGTALGIVRSAHQQNKVSSVFASETRPWMQGSRLTAWELMQENIPVTICTEAAVGHLMSNGKISAVIVGADRLSANGDLANKIGTYNLAVLARYHEVPFIAAVPMSTIDFQTDNGADIEIEFRDPSELTKFGDQAVAAAGANAINPAFDVTPAELVSYLVTEHGVIERPNRENINLLRKTLS
jgi:methylthioribose-1-phosphate isomerase